LVRHKIAGDTLGGGRIMKDTIKEGLKYTHRYRVPESKTVPYIYQESKPFQEIPKVFATGYMVALMEWACTEAMAPHLEPGECSVGIDINVNHTAATPPGMEVIVDVLCTNVDGQRTSWEIVARDEVDEIGRGSHERFTVNIDRFNARVADKTGRASNVV